ncbi:MAG: glycosyltransferase family 2 protein, partial [Bacteroidota bacterium]
RKKILQQNPNLDMIHGGLSIIGDEFVPDINNTKNLISIKECVVGGTFVIRRDRALAIGGYDAVEYGEDHLLFEKARSAGWKVARTQAETYVYRRDHPDSLCNKIKNKYK